MSESAPVPSCPRCGEQLPERAVFCPACGTRIAGDTPGSFSRYPPPLVQSRRAVARVAKGLGERARTLAETAAIRSNAQRELNRLRYVRLELLERRNTRLAELGDAVYTEDAAKAERARKEISKLDKRVADAEAQMKEIAADAEERVRKTHLPTRDTEVSDRPRAGSSD